MAGEKKNLFDGIKQALNFTIKQDVRNIMSDFIRRIRKR